MELRKFVVSEFLFGKAALSLAGRYALKFQAKKALIVTDPGIVNAGWVRLVEESLIESGVDYAIFSAITPNPKDFEVMEGSNLFVEEDCDVLIAVGGGSPIDCAKGIGIVCSNQKHINQFEGVDNIPLPTPPLICIPTTAGTSADISQFAIITNSDEKRKIAIVSKKVVPNISLIDPYTTTTMNKRLTAATGMDVLTHAIEAYVSKASSPITDLHALEAIKLTNKNLNYAVNEPDNITYRTNMMLASLYAGMAFSNASLGIVHAMAHSLGAIKDSAHGECNAIILEHSIDFNFDNAPEKYRQILDALDIDTEGMNNNTIKEELCNHIVLLRKSLNIDYSLESMGIKKGELDKLAENAYNDACLASNPKKASVEQIRKLYEKVF